MKSLAVAVALLAAALFAGCDLSVRCNEPSDCPAGAPFCVVGQCSAVDAGDDDDDDDGEGEGEGEPGGEGEGEAAGEGEGEAGGEGEGEAGVALHVQLTWTSGTDDLDVRGIRKDGSGRFCAAADFFNSTPTSTPSGPLAELCATAPLSCSYVNCRSDGAAPDWDGSGGQSRGDPSIDVDQLQGLGPENLNVGSLADGEYLFGAMPYVSPAGTAALMKVFVGGSLEGERDTNVAAATWTELFFVRARAGVVCVDDLSDGSAGTDCP